MEEMNMQPEVSTHEQAFEEVAPQQEMVAAAEQTAHKDREYNLSVLREKAERAERERDEAIRYIQHMQMQQSNQSPVDDDHNIAPDDFTEKRYVDSRINKIESKLRQYEQYTQNNIADAKIRSQFNDFDQVVTPESIEVLRNTYPEIAQSLHATPDLYSKAVSTYNIIKKFGIGRQYNPQVEYERGLVEKNNLKPRATNSIAPQQGETPLNKANEWANGVLTPERKAQLYKEMMEAKNNW